MGKPRHVNTLVPSDKSCLEICEALEQRFLTVCRRYKQKWGVDIVIPEILKPDFIRWRTMVSRYNKRDFRHTEAEEKSVRELCQWTVDVNCELCSQPATKIKW